ncbi:hypothetical protein MLD38_008675 [Melastoma candidum]|uniref:Uncharacterized protein n=1 Tax=Melastoma candidum TaxID=119954 RepID=A0ACB9RU83_9MYRT|nr:hypothetical protein MLD38_008675 [Melastoma candidum]
MAMSRAISAVLVLTLAVAHVACGARCVNSIAAPEHSPVPAVAAVSPTHDVVKVTAPEASVTETISTVRTGKFLVGIPLYRDRSHPNKLIPSFRVETYREQITVPGYEHHLPGTLYKGTLSSGVEAVASGPAKSAKNWSTSLEPRFKKTVETLSKVASEIKSPDFRLLTAPFASRAADTNAYAFGMFLFEMLTGRLPYSTEDNGSVEDWASDYLRGEKQVEEMVNPSLESFDKKQV